MSKNNKKTKCNAAVMLVNGCTHTTICSQLHIRASTLARWRQQAEFITLLERYKREQQQNIEFQLLDIAETIVKKTQRDISSGMGNTTLNLSRVLATLQALKTLPNTPQTSPKSSEKEAKPAKTPPQFC